MPNRLNIPPELSVLIEKREGEERRRAAEAEAEAARVRAAATDVSDDPTAEERRSGVDRRGPGSA